jgi:hypothetical protein
MPCFSPGMHGRAHGFLKEASTCRIVRPHRPASPPRQDQDISDSEPPRESMASGRGARQQRVHRNDERYTARGQCYPPDKVAHPLLECSTHMPRPPLRPGSGAGFLGAPLHRGPRRDPPRPRGPGDARGPSSTSAPATPGDSAPVCASPAESGWAGPGLCTGRADAPPYDLQGSASPWGGRRSAAQACAPGPLPLRRRAPLRGVRTALRCRPPLSKTSRVGCAHRSMSRPTGPRTLG